MKFSKSIYFKDIFNKQHFLFQIVNFGKNNDEIKFIFNSPSLATGIIYRESQYKFSNEDFVRPYFEITYHSDGALLVKFPKYSNRTKTIYKNPSGIGYKRVPLRRISDWEPIIKGTIVQYRLCRKKLSSDLFMIPENINIFNGDPFEYIIFLGNSKNHDPLNNQMSETVVRINNVAINIDLIIWIYKSDYRGVWIKEGDKHFFNNSNLIQIVEKNKSYFEDI